MSDQRGFFDLDERYQRTSEAGDCHKEEFNRLKIERIAFAVSAAVMLAGLAAFADEAC